MKSFKIGERLEEKIVETTMGPGAYDIEKGDAITRVKTTNINMGTAKSRADLVTSTTDIGPGQYNDSKQFGTDGKSFKIGERRDEKIMETMGPGLYDIERGDAVTRTKTVNVTMGTSPSRA